MAPIPLRLGSCSSILFSIVLIGALCGGANAFSPSEGHRLATSNSLERLGFCPDVIDEVIDHNKDVDRSQEFLFSAPHCDNEALPECHERILDLRKKTIDGIKTFDGGLPDPTGTPFTDNPWEALGEALHTLQDFYSHTNWIDLNNLASSPQGPHPSFAQPGTSFAKPPNTSKPCPSGDGTTPVFPVPGAVSGGLTSGYFDLGLIFGLTGALVQAVSPCNVYPEVQAGKCAHGHVFNCKGINKDKSPKKPASEADASDFSGSYHGAYSDALEAATDASEAFVQTILNELTEEQQEVLKFKRKEESPCGIDVAFVIDVSGSMADDIAAVKASVETIVAKAEATTAAASATGDPKVVSRYILSTFSDPQCGDTIIVNDAAEFLTALGSLGVSGGGDCPELRYCGVIAAMQAMAGDARLPPDKSDSLLYVYTDASAKDAFLGPAFTALQARLNVVPRFLLTGVCVDPSRRRRSLLQDVAEMGAGLVEGTEPYVAGSEILEQEQEIALQTGGLLYLSEDISELQDVVTNLLEVDLASNKAAVANFEVPFDLPFNQVFCEGMLLPWDSVCTGPAFAACTGEESFKDSLCDGYLGPTNCTTKAASFPIDDSVSQFSVIVTGPFSDAGTQASLIDPSGAELMPESEGVSVIVGAAGSVIYRVSEEALAAAGPGNFSLEVCYVGPNTQFSVRVVAVSPYAVLSGGYYNTPQPWPLGEMLGELQVTGAPLTNASYESFQARIRGNISESAAVYMYYADVATGTEMNGTRRELLLQTLTKGAPVETHLARTRKDGEGPHPVPSDEFAVYLSIEEGSEQVVRVVPGIFVPVLLSSNVLGSPVQVLPELDLGEEFLVALNVSHGYSACVAIQAGFVMEPGSRGLSVAGNETVEFGVAPGESVIVYATVAVSNTTVSPSGQLTASFALIEESGEVSFVGVRSTAFLSTNPNGVECPGSNPLCGGSGFCLDGECVCLPGFECNEPMLDAADPVAEMLPPLCDGDAMPSESMPGRSVDLGAYGDGL